MAELLALSVDALDPEGLARFWEGLLGWGRVEDHAGAVALAPRDDTGFRLRFPRTSRTKSVPNTMHFDLTSRSLEEQRGTVARALALGARELDVGQGPDAEHVVLADPEGNEMCVIEPGNSFLADCGFVGALSSDGTRELGLFWSRALGWPLVWDQDEETAIRSPRGGPKVTWGGPPLPVKQHKNRLHLDVVPSSGRSLEDEVARLVGLGASPIDAHAGHVVMTDPDGGELCVWDQA